MKYNNSMKYYPATKNNDLMIQSTTCMHFKCLILSEGRQIPTIHSMISFREHSAKGKIIGIGNRVVVSNDEG